MSTLARKPATPQARADETINVLIAHGVLTENQREGCQALLIELQRQAVEPILRAAASVIRPCKACGAELFFVLHPASGKQAPYTAGGVNHFIGCPNAKEFKR